MLVLTRNINEVIFIDNDIQIIILDVKDTQVRIGIEAPKKISILREELCPTSDEKILETVK